MSSVSPRFSRLFRAWLALPAEAPASLPPPTDTSLPLLVVGAGPAGLAAMAALREAGVEFEAVDGHSQVGGIWDISNPLSSVYEGLSTVTSRFTSHLGTPLSEDWPVYLPHEQVLEYFVHFAQSNGLTPSIRFSTRFADAVKTERGTWLVTLQRTDCDETEQAEYRGIVIATGSHNKLQKQTPQFLWDQAAAAGIHAIHSADYKSPDEFAGKRVLVIGVGNSGTDIAEKVSAAAARVLLSIRTAPWINPPTMFGVPCDKLAAEQSWIPDWLGMTVFHLGRRLVIGSFRRLGLSRPKCRLNDRVPVTDRGIVRAIREGRVVTRSEAVRFDNGMVYFADPRHPAEPVDAVIFATGFERRYPLLSQGITDDDAPLFQLFHRTEPGLAFQTEMVGLRSCWPIFVEQGKVIAAYFAAEGRGSARVEAFNARRTLPTPNCKGKLFCLGDPYHVDYAIYTRLVRDLATWLSADEPRDRTVPSDRPSEKLSVSPS
jgi:cation diffusion facilitator CzcD-associated flavoprotein CzcO